MLEKTNYVPILRRRSAELGALTNLLNEDLNNVVPLFEMCEHILPEADRTALLEQDIRLHFWKVIRSIGAAYGNRPYFIDFGHVEGLFASRNGLHPIATYFDLLIFNQLGAIPVTGLVRPDFYQQGIEYIVKEFETGLCLRITKGELRSPSFVPFLTLFLRRFGLDPEKVDLLIDLKEYGEDTPSIDEICARVPMLLSWRNFIVACGAFPKFLSELQKNEEHELPRHDWLYWRSAANSREIRRIPTYADYTIQYSEPPQPLDFLPNPSASIRYAAPDYWVIMRGEGLRNPNGAGFAQYWGQANSLLYRPEFSGRDYCYGDQYVAEIGSQTVKTGNPLTWLRAGINRHITLVVHQIHQATSASTTSTSVRASRFTRPPLPRIWNKSRLNLPEHFGQGSLFPPSSF